MTLLEATGVTKRYGDTVALDALDLRAASGELLAVLGRNGAGKTTLVNLIATLQRPDQGSLRVRGIDVVASPTSVRRLIGLAGQQATVEPLLTGRENLEIVAALFGLGRRDARAAASELLESLDLSDVGDRQVGTYSGGMRRRLDLGASLIGAPSLLLLDEPTTGLDPASRHQLWERIRFLVSSGTDVLLTTQYLEEADVLADRIVVLERGRIIADGSPAELKKRHGGAVVTIRVNPTERVSELANGDTASGVATWSSDDPGRATADMLRAADAAGIRVEEVTVRQPSLEEVFLDLTKESAA